MPTNKNIKIIVNYILGPALFLILLYSIYRQLHRQADWRESVQVIEQTLTGSGRWKIIAALLLTVANWGIESWKWQIAIKPVQRVSWSRAGRAILAGITVSSFTPNRVGEYLGRIMYVDEGKRLESIPLSILCSVAQLLITLIAGIPGIFYLQWYLRHYAVAGHPFLHASLNLFGIGLLTGAALMLVCYFRLPRIVSWVSKRSWAEKYVKLLNQVPPGLLVRILCLSFLRYLVFILQYGLLFSAFDVQLTWTQLAAGTAVMFLVMAVVPSITLLADLGIRWEASIQLMELFSINTVGILAASMGIWIINLVIPALAGSLLILGIKIFNVR